MIAKCEHCGLDVFHIRDADGAMLVLDSFEVLGGKYEMVNGVASLRLTPGGRVKTSGKGMRLHAGYCGGLSKPSQDSAVVTDRPDPLLTRLQAEPRYEQATSGKDVPSAVRDAVELIGPEGNVTDYHDWTGTPTGKTKCAVCGRVVIVAHYFALAKPDADPPPEPRFERPVILDAQAVPHLGAWRAYKRKGESDIVATFLGKREELARYVNHRHTCPETKPA